MNKTAKKSEAHKALGATPFSCHAPDARTVFVAGSFNGWDPTATQLTHAENGDWTVALPLAPGRYEYKFVIDGRWCCEPGCDATNHDCPKCVPNPFGTMNRFVEVPA